MTIGLGIILLVLGLILLTGAVDLPDDLANAIASEPLGWIFVIAGGLAIVIGVLLSVNRSQHTTAVEHRRYDAGPGYGDGPAYGGPQGPYPGPPQGNYPPAGPPQGSYPPGPGPSQGGYPGGRGRLD
ncbi:putative membrane protein [Nocardioides luteus]|uniref:Uncharacterized protein n=1 Tax=Nocardioides luteus TaxID=1844 RepID=A0ABQ5SYY2_9ACTN|nr:hypothetical protein [Nocardioides luteus]MDR7312520.1 putative membrane protein [Nocardioides luteus]GGR45724.1 hypothetical protein GCM10010197_09040 [Nocardioides luteus]GLJ68768.1 hypothetical protein GCM10017579_28040 [Nocardioides luteus]